MLSILLQILLISFLVNFIWEVIHSQLYATCLRAELKKYIPLIIGASLKDGFWICVFFLVCVLPFGNIYILTNGYQILIFVFLAIAFSFVDEKISLKMKRWEYSKEMPTVFGVGITPLFQLAVTGMVTFAYVFWV